MCDQEKNAPPRQPKSIPPSLSRKHVGDRCSFPERGIGLRTSTMPGESRMIIVVAINEPKLNSMLREDRVDIVNEVPASGDEREVPDLCHLCL